MKADGLTYEQIDDVAGPNECQGCIDALHGLPSREHTCTDDVPRPSMLVIERYDYRAELLNIVRTALDLPNWAPFQVPQADGLVYFSKYDPAQWASDLPMPAHASEGECIMACCFDVFTAMQQGPLTQLAAVDHALGLDDPRRVRSPDGSDRVREILRLQAAAMNVKRGR